MPSKMAGNRATTPPPDSGSGTQTTRIQRNLAEKNRRDKLNGFINELATIVPMVAMASKRLDKTSILRLSAAHLRIYHSSLSGRCKKAKASFRWQPNFLNSEQIREILDAVDGFLLVTTTNGKIMYISQSVEKFLGHQHIEMIGLSLFLFIHPSDLDMVQAQLQALSLAVSNKNTKGNSNSSSARCSFYCRMRERSQPRSEVLTYQFVHVVGHMSYNSSDDEMSSGDDEENAPRASHNNPLLKAFVRVVHSNPYNELSLSAAVEDEYVTRHSLDGTIIFADHRLSTITGHLPHEVYGMSAYEYIAQEDIPIALFAHKLMFSQESGTGLIVYRLRTRNQGFVYLKSTGYLQFERSSSQVDHFVCVNRQLSEDDGEKELKNFIDRFTPHINGSSPSSLYESIRAVQASGLAAPPAISLKSEITVAVSDDCSHFTKLRDKNSRVKSECDEQMTVLEKTEQKSSGDGIIRSKNNHMYIGCFSSKRILEKISLESENVGQVFPSPSPLTESSLSANSPQSDETSIASPHEGSRWSVDSIYHSPDTCSSPNMPTSPLSPSGKDHDMIDSSALTESSKSAGTSPVQNLTSINVTEVPDTGGTSKPYNLLSPTASDTTLKDASDNYVRHLATPPLLPINNHIEPMADQNDETRETEC